MDAMKLPPPPPATVPVGSLPPAVFDTECYPNFWLLRLRPIGGQTYAFRLYAGQSFNFAQQTAIRQVFASYMVISFNGLGYDVPMLRGALAGYTTEQLKWLNDQMIVHKVKPWELQVPDWQPANHIDVMEVAPGAGSQKQYAGRIHCKTMRDLPYDPGSILTPEQIEDVDAYCDNDLDVLLDLYNACRSLIKQRERLGKRYGLDLRSKSDAQVAEAVLKARCEAATGRRIFKPEIDWNMRFQFRIPEFISYATPQLQRALELVRGAWFHLGATGAVEMPYQLEGLEITIGQSTYKVGIGGLHSQEKKLIAHTDAESVVLMPDVASYYPNLMLNSGEYPPALGPDFPREYASIKDERIADKAKAKALAKAGDTTSVEYEDAATGDAGGKIMINGTFGKTGSPYSVLFAPTMLIQTTLTGQLSLLMLIEWLELYEIPVISANTDGLVIKCPRARLDACKYLIAEWERRTRLDMEIAEYRSIYARDVNNYFAIDAEGDVKRKGEYAKAGLVEKKNPDVEICADAVADFLAKGVPIIQTITMCLDIRKFVTIQKVAGGGVKMWGEGPRKGELVRNMVPTLEANGWVKAGRYWRHPAHALDMSPGDAYQKCFMPQRPEYLGKVVRWYYGTKAPGPIVYAKNGNTVSMSYGAQPCMTLPDEFPSDIDYSWYVAKAEAMLRDVGYYRL